MLLVVALLNAGAARGQSDELSRSWNQPVEPFQIAANVYYVGASDVTSFLITSPRGHFLLDSGLLETVPQIVQNVGKLGFKMSDVRIILNSHAHYDHAGGLAELKRLSGGKLYASRADAAALGRGGRDDFAWGDKYAFERVMVDRVFDHGDVFTIGDVEMKAIVTPGHTRGCTSWSLTRRVGGKPLRFIFVGSTTTPGYDLPLLTRTTYPEIVDDYRKAFERLSKVNANVFLAAHGSFFNLKEKIAKRATANSANPFIVAGEFQAFVKRSAQNFERTLIEQQNKKVGR